MPSKSAPDGDPRRSGKGRDHRRSAKRGDHRAPAKRVRLTERDRVVLEFAAEHRLVLAAQVGVLLGTSADAAATRLRLLAQAGYMRFERRFAGPGSYLIDRRGLA